MAHQWRTVGVSVIAHIVGIFFLVVIPLLAMDGFPLLKGATYFVPVDMKAPDLPPPLAPPRSALAPTTTAVATIPMDAPSTIEPERPASLPNVQFRGVPGGAGLPTGVRGGTGIDGFAPPPAPPLPKQTGPVRAGGQVKAPERLVNVQPEYPATARAAHLEGTVVIDAIIDTDGTVKDARVIQSAPLFDQAALAAVRKWRYSATTLNGIPVSVVMTVSVRFTLK